MPIKIHHGPPGSFKTSGALADDFLRMAEEGRVIVTNVRGLNRERVLVQFPDLPDSFDVIYVDDKTPEGRDRLAKWFHWVPKGAYLFIDEVQDIWPRRWKESDIRALDYPGGLSKASADDRPFCWEQAFDKHRHWNWDMALTCPAYSKVRDDVKDVADAAYKHKDLALIGWTGRYLEAMHMADDSGKADSHFLNKVQKKVPSYVFKLYDSTATGSFRFNLNGFNLFGSPRIMLLLGVLALALWLGFRDGNFSLMPQSAKASDSKPAGQTAVKANQASGGVVGRDTDTVSFSQDARLEPFLEEDAYILVSYKVGRRYRYSVRFKGADVTQTDLLDMGYAVTDRGACAVEISKDRFRRVLTCGLPEKKEPGQKEAPPTVVASAPPMPLIGNETVPSGPHNMPVNGS